MKSGGQLLREYAENGSESAFTELVTRHTNLVYSAAYRQVDSPEQAADITQRVFIALARAARGLAPRMAQDASLAGWLCRTARNLTLNLRRDEFRRRTRERHAMEMLTSGSEISPDWESIRPLLDEAMSQLSDRDYDAVVMHFFNNQELRTVARALGITEDAAQKRVSRAIEKLQRFLARRGISTTSAALSAVLSAHAVQTAPAGLAITASTAALVSGAAAHGSVAVATTKIAMTAIQKVLITATLASAVGAGLYEHHQLVLSHQQANQFQQQTAELTDQIQQLEREHNRATNEMAQINRSPGLAEDQLQELLRLRGEVTRLRSEAQSPPNATTGRAAVQASEQALSAAAGSAQPATLAQLLDLAQAARASLRTNQAGLSDDQKGELYKKAYGPLYEAFNALTDKAVKGDASALQTIQNAAAIRELQALAVQSLGVLAGNGDQSALQLLLEPAKNHLLMASVVGALKPAADNGDPRAIDALAAVAADPKQPALWMMAADGLSKAAETGNAVAINALTGLAGSTNQLIRDAAFNGLARSAARENPQAVQAIRQLKGQ